MSHIEFKFKPLKGGKEPDTKAKDEPKETETDAEDSGEYSKAELGKGLASALKSGDGEAIYEACMKCMNATPSDE